MNFTPFTYNNRNNIKTNIQRQPRESEGNNYTNQYSNLHTNKNYQPWNRNEQKNMKPTLSKAYNHIQGSYGRVMTEGNTPSDNSKPITPSTYQQPMLYQLNQNNKFNSNDLFKSNIYPPNQNPNDRLNLNNSGGTSKINYNHITPPRKQPRASQPLLPSNSEIPYISNQFYKPNVSNNTTMDSPINLSEKEHNFIKNKNSHEQSEELHTFTSEKNQKKRSIEENFRGIQLPKMKVNVDDFIQIKQLGAGKYGRVYLVRQKNTGFICALKIIQKKLLTEQQITEQFIRQIKIQIYLHHPNIVKMYGFFNDRDNIYIILQVATDGQLFHLIKKSQSLPEIKVATIMRQLCDAVTSIHSMRIIHRDIKPENIVMHYGVIKLCDFGWSVHQDKNLRTTFCGTPLYVCPEILKGKQYDEKIDIWSLGIMMYEMLVGQNPFRITKEEQLIKIIKDEIIIPSYANLTKQAKDFLDRCLKKNPNQRWTIRQLSDHQFFKKYPEKQKNMKFD